MQTTAANEDRTAPLLEQNRHSGNAAVTTDNKPTVPGKLKHNMGNNSEQAPQAHTQ